MIASRKHAPRGVDFDHVHAVLELRRPRGGPGRLHRRFCSRARRGTSHADLRCIVVQVAMPSGDRNPRSAGHDPRAGDETFVDRRTQIDARNGRLPTSRIVVKPASSVIFACFTAAKAL